MEVRLMVVSIAYIGHLPIPGASEYPIQARELFSRKSLLPGEIAAVEALCYSGEALDWPIKGIQESPLVG